MKKYGLDTKIKDVVDLSGPDERMTERWRGKDVRRNKATDLLKLYDDTFGELLDRLKVMRPVICGFVHEREDISFGAARCPYRKGNLVCGHLTEFEDGDLLRSVVWLFEQLSSLEKTQIDWLRYRIEEKMIFLLKADYGAEMGLKLPIASYRNGNVVLDELRDFGVLRSRKDPERPSMDQVEKKLGEIQADIAVEMMAIRDRLIGVFEEMIESDEE